MRGLGLKWKKVARAVVFRDRPRISAKSARRRVLEHRRRARQLAAVTLSPAELARLSGARPAAVALAVLFALVLAAGLEARGHGKLGGEATKRRPSSRQQLREAGRLGQLVEHGDRRDADEHGAVVDGNRWQPLSPGSAPGTWCTSSGETFTLWLYRHPSLGERLAPVWARRRP